MSRRNLSYAVFGAVLVVTSSGCGPRAGEAPTIAPGSGDEGRGPEPVGPHEGESSQELAARLVRLRARQKGLIPAATGDKAACEDVCSLATSICGVQEKLCSIADEHAQDDQYQHLCREAKVECREAQEACVRCVEGHTEDGPQ